MHRIEMGGKGETHAEEARKREEEMGGESPPPAPARTSHEGGIRATCFRSRCAYL